MSKDIILSLDQIRYAMGDKAEEFVEVMLIVDDIIENPGRYIGMQAAKTIEPLLTFGTLGTGAGAMAALQRKRRRRKRRSCMVTQGQ